MKDWQKLLLSLQLIKINQEVVFNLIILHHYSPHSKINDCLLKDFVIKEELLQPIYFLKPLRQQFVTIIFNVTRRSVLDWAIMYLIVVGNFTLIKAVVVVALIKVEPIFYSSFESFMNVGKPN